MESNMKYKAKRKDNGEWVYWDAMSGLCGIEVDEATICQAIGMEDKCGNIMYKHDIFKHYSRLSFDEPDYYELGTVVWDEKHCRFTNKKWVNNEIYVLSTECVYEVIGNIFDNPELLEENNGSDRRM